LNACELYVAPDTALILADCAEITFAGNDAIRATGYLVVALVIWTFVILSSAIVSETVTLPRRDVPVAEYVPFA
jgi:hypothetical protein